LFEVLKLDNKSRKIKIEFFNKRLTACIAIVISNSSWRIERQTSVLACLEEFVGGCRIYKDRQRRRKSNSYISKVGLVG
jgi:hypothetical protein